jgi:REP element-mobilizing transposase RayT
MYRQDYVPDELKFAYCYHAYLRWSSYRRRPCEPLASLDTATLNALAAPFHIHVLESRSSPTDLRVLVSLRPTDSISACTSKLKGRLSRWLREALRLERPTNLLAKGYFASTSGKSTHEQVEQYLEQQAGHHGYACRAVPPVYVAQYVPSPALEARCRASHAATRLQLHLVLATQRRHGVFAAPEAMAVAGAWEACQASLRFALLKVSFLPDHVHVAVRVHPGLTPADLVLTLMNGAQEVIWDQFPEAAIEGRIERLWQPSAYIGSFGDLASPQIAAYVRDWMAQAAEG